MSEAPTCEQCGRAEDHSKDEEGKFKVELRPYGPGGTNICFQCATATPEAEEAAAKAFMSLLEAHDALPGITIISEDGLGKINPEDLNA